MSCALQAPFQLSSAIADGQTWITHGTKSCVFERGDLVEWICAIQFGLQLFPRRVSFHSPVHLHGTSSWHGHAMYCEDTCARGGLTRIEN